MGFIERFIKKNWLKDVKSFDYKHANLEEYCAKDNEGNVLLNATPAVLFEPLDQDHLSRDLLSFVDEEEDLIPLAERMHLVIHGNYTDEEQEKARDLFKKHYEREMSSRQRDFRFNTIKTTYLLLLGAILLGVSYIFSKYLTGFFSELLSIAASFSLWECVDSFVLERKDIRSEMISLFRRFLCTITFET